MAPMQWDPRSVPALAGLRVCGPDIDRASVLQSAIYHSSISNQLGPEEEAATMTWAACGMARQQW
jgi:hypothetical protein